MTANADVGRPCLVGPATKSRPVCLECLTLLRRQTSADCAGCGFPMCDRRECLQGKTHARECHQLARLERELNIDWSSQARAPLKKSSSR